MTDRMKIERAAKLVTGLLPMGRDDVREAWSVIADLVADRGQYPRPWENRRDGALDFETYKAKVEIVGANLSAVGSSAERRGDAIDVSVGPVPLHPDEKMAPEVRPTTAETPQ